MMPGLQMYRALGVALQLARLRNAADLPTIARTPGDAALACLVVGALALGLLVGTRTVRAVAGEPYAPITSSAG